MKYTPPLDSQDQDAGYVNADPANGTEGSKIPAEALENPQREIINAITDAGLTPSTDNSQLKQAINKKVQAMVDECRKAVQGFIATDAEFSAGTSASKVPNVKQIEQNQPATLIADRLYQGQNLATKFASEIASYASVWLWIKARIQAGNFAGIHVGDYIPFTTTAGTVGSSSVGAASFNAQIAGIDTYYGFGDTQAAHHIDFITKEVFPLEIKWNPTDNNNGTATYNNPWLACALKGLLNGENNSSTGYGDIAHGINAAGKGLLQRLPADLQNAIVTKRMIIEKRFSTSGLLTASNGWDWNDMGKLWVPNENEVYGCQVWSASFPNTEIYPWASHGTVQYPLFAATCGRICNRIKPIAGQPTSRSTWWLCTTRSGLSSHACLVSHYGEANGNMTTNTGIRAPLCFRIA